MKNALYYISVLILLLAIASCKKKEPMPAPTPAPTHDFRDSYTGQFKLTYHSIDYNFNFNGPGGKIVLDTTYDTIYTVNTQITYGIKDSSFSYGVHIPAIWFIAANNNKDTVDELGVDKYGNLYNSYPYDHGGFVTKDSINYSNALVIEDAFMGSYFSITGTRVK